jgi:hypothetical protein
MRELLRKDISMKELVIIAVLAISLKKTHRKLRETQKELIRTSRAHDKSPGNLDEYIQQDVDNAFAEMVEHYDD